MKHPGETSWGSHLGSVSSLMDMFNHVCVVHQNLARDSIAGTHHANGDIAYNYMITFEFVFIICMMREILEITEQLGQALQKKANEEEALEGQLEHRKLTGSDICSLEH
jgi:hypothetical protein